MKSFCALMLLLGSAVVAQENQAPVIIEGIPLSVSVIRDLSTTRAKAGDKIELAFLGEVKDKTGKVIANKQSKLTGRVTEAVKRDGQHPEARLAVILDQLVTNGTALPLHGIFCGRLQLPTTGKLQKFGNQERWMGPPADWELPRDVELKPMTDVNIGSVVVSKQDNIEFVHGRPFFICNQTSAAPTADADGRQVVAPASLPSGVDLVVTLTAPLDTAKVRNGDTVQMVMFSNLLGPNQTIAIPKDARIDARILAAQPANGSNPSQLVILAERASWTGGSVPFLAFINDIPRLPSETMSKMFAKGGMISVDLHGITVSEMPSGGTGLSRHGQTIQLPEGTQLVFQTR